jgi:hypothetical protein
MEIMDFGGDARLISAYGRFEADGRFEGAFTAAA